MSESLIQDLFTAGLTAIGTLVLFLLKERIDKKKERQKEEANRLDYFKSYTEPLLEYCYSLQKRLFDIFKHKANFVYKTAQINDFQEYHYISTLYRLCAVLGWIRAVNRELTGIELSNNNSYERLKTSIKTFEKSLTNKDYAGSGRLEYLARKWSFDLSSLSESQEQYLENTLNNLIWDRLIHANVAYAKDLGSEDQDLLLKDLADKIAQVSGNECLDETSINSSHDQIISVLSRKEAWIYSNWQQAIGDMMLRQEENSNKMRSYEVLGFREFESLYLSSETTEHADIRWINRVDNLFRDLDVKKDIIFDARISLLKNLYTCLIKLIESLELLSGMSEEEIKAKLDALTKKSLDEASLSTQEEIQNVSS